MTFDEALEELKSESPESREYWDELETEANVCFALSEARKRKGMSQRQLAKLSGVPQARISRIEDAKIEPRAETVRKLAACLDLELQIRLVPKHKTAEPIGTMNHAFSD